MITIREVDEGSIKGFSIFKDDKEIAFFLDRGIAYAFLDKELRQEEEDFLKLNRKSNIFPPQAPKLFL